MVESNLQHGGAVLFWSIGTATDIERMRTALADEGMADLAPEYRAAATVAGEAIQATVGGPLTSVTPLAKHRGWFVAHIERGTARNAFHDWFTLDLGRWANENGINMPSETFQERLALHSHQDTWAPNRRNRKAAGAFWGELTVAMGTAFTSLARIARPAQVTTALVGVVDRLGGTRLRPSGGLYWLAQGERLNRFQRLADRIEAAATMGAKSRLYVIRHPLDVGALRAVRDAIQAEIERDAATIRDAVTAVTAKADGLASLEAQAAALASKVTEYESILGEPLPGLATLAQDAKASAAMARLSLSAQGGRHAA